jgi:hypothetical protein
MFPLRTLAALLGLCSALALIPSAALAQGALAPLGAPAPTMKSLDQLEPRTPLSAATAPGSATATHVISSPGSYYLTGNLSAAPGKHGIEIASTGVTLDLNGFSLIGDGSAACGIILAPSGASLAQIRIHGGQIRFFGQDGIRATNGLIDDLTVSQVQIRVSGVGLDVSRASPALLTHLNVYGGSSGILASFTGSIVQDSVVSRVAGTSVTSGIGVSANLIARCLVGQMTGATAPLRGDSIFDSSVVNCSSAAATFIAAIQGRDVRNCRVDTFSQLAAGSTAVTGISSTTATHCLVNNLHSAATGNLSGIVASDVSQSRVENIGNNGDTNAALIQGINASGSVDSSAVNLLGSTTFTGNMVGIRGSRNVVDCSASLLRAGGSIVGIAAGFNCQNSSVSSLVQTASSLTVTGIQAALISECTAHTLSANNGLAQYALNAATILNSRVENATISGGGVFNALGYDTVGQVTVHGCTAHRCDYGIFYGASGGSLTATDNVINLSGREGILFAASSPGQGRLENNTVHRATTATGAGILVSTGTAALVVRNRVTGGNATKYNVSATSQVGPIVSATGTLAATVHPWANFSD